jgi:hypothetical protein
MANDTNLVLGKNATASSYVAPYTPGKAVNGIKTSSMDRWLNSQSTSSSQTASWLMVDLQVPCALSRWVTYLLPYNATWPQTMYGMQNYNLQTSMDALNWTNVDIVTGNTLPVTDRTIAPLAVGRFVRLFAAAGIKANAQETSILELEVYGHPVSADLASLVLSSGALVPAFAPATTAYTQQVTYAVSSLTVTPTAVDSTSSITVNGTRVVSGQATAPINLNVGANTITVVVTPVYGAAKTYTVAVTREDSAYLTSLALKSGTNSYDLNPAFSKTQGAYTATVPYGATTVTVTPVAEGTTSTIKVNGTLVASGSASAPISMNVGVNPVITVESSLPLGTKQTYTIAVTRADSVLLTQVVVTPVGRGAGPAVTVPMNATDVTYSAAVAGNTSNFTVTPYAVSTSVTIKVNNNTVVSGSASPSISLATSPAAVQIVVTSTIDSSSRTYTVNVSK